MTVVVIDYGAGNTRSVRAALHHLGTESKLSADPEDIASARQVILPGVGSAKSAMAHMRTTKADIALRERFDSGQPILGICLGMQLAAESSEEDGGVTCLGLVAGHVERLHAERVPRLGWAMVEPWNEAFYFAHSYHVVNGPTTATSEGVSVAIQSGSFLGVQFHPEKSGRAGLEFLRRCL